MKPPSPKAGLSQDPCSPAPHSTRPHRGLTPGRADLSPQPHAAGNATLSKVSSSWHCCEVHNSTGMSESDLWGLCG